MARHLQADLTRNAGSKGAPVALITGAANGIGAETSHQLVGRGWQVAAVDVDGGGLDVLARQLGDQALAIRGDVSDLAAMEAAVATAVERFGGLDVVVANAGIEILGPVESIAPADFGRVIDVDLLGVWHTLRAALPGIVERKGYILVVTSMAAVTQAPFNAAYAAAKAGIVTLAKTLRMELTDAGVDVGIIYFGLVGTDAAQRAISHPAMAPIMTAMPARMRRPMPVRRAALAVVGAIEKRSRRVVVPRSMAPAVFAPELFQWLGERLLGRVEVRWRE